MVEKGLGNDQVRSMMGKYLTRQELDAINSKFGHSGEFGRDSGPDAGQRNNHNDYDGDYGSNAGGRGGFGGSSGRLDGGEGRYGGSRGRDVGRDAYGNSGGFDDGRPPLRDEYEDEDEYEMPETTTRFSKRRAIKNAFKKFFG